ncbi:hypothetical protein [Micromonospora sp. NPDC002575]|uniref:hypothetical protein n=1 Tax=Micromonospora sp. NPDC002575 TaxID=3364222 RepID=UPI0036A78154
MEQRVRHSRDLVDGLAERPYVFVEHRLGVGEAVGFRSHPHDHRSFVVVAGQVRVEQRSGDGSPREYGALRGWHAPPGAVYRFTQVGAAQAIVVEAGSDRGDPVTGAGATPVTGCLDVDDYLVEKPWGHEVWYTNNLPGATYALKQIHMTAGHQSSLQSHQRKVETNYVVTGEAIVLNGTPAPADPGAVVDAAAIPRAGHGPGSSWTSDANILHRVIADTDYTSVEVSTTELDDVIRWADDTNRGNGRIDAEHLGRAR